MPTDRSAPEPGRARTPTAADGSQHAPAARQTRRRHPSGMRTSVGHVGLIVLSLLVVYAALLGTAGAVAGQLPLPVESLVVNGAAALIAIVVVLASYRWFGARRSMRGYGLAVDRSWLRELVIGAAIGLTAVALNWRLTRSSDGIA